MGAVRKRTNGIGYYMYPDEGSHNVAHVHVYYGGFEYAATIAVLTQQVLAGELPAKQLAEAQAWIRDNALELNGMWKRRFKAGGIYRIEN